MATYTNTGTFQRDVMPSGTDDTFPRILERAASMAYEYINSRLSTAYTVPFAAPYPGGIVAISDLLTKCIATSLQARRTPILPKPGKQKRDQVDGDCALAILWLDDIVAGRATIPGIAVAANAAGYHTRDGYTPIFDVDSSLNHQPDPDLIDRIHDERD